MPIPDFNAHGLLPPYAGDPTKFGATSPYQATTLELCMKFATSPKRCSILRGFLAFRHRLQLLRITDGYQWVNGPFLERDGKRSGGPDHIQVVTFCHPSPLLDDPSYCDLFETLKSARKTRAEFSVEHGFVPLSFGANDLINWTRHWAAQLSHQKETGLWKGHLKVDLDTPEVDAASLKHLDAIIAK
jgi:hypothetical protein